MFVKRIPLTDLELANPWSTRNLYSIPTYYNYGVGSAGFGAFRELVANIKTTNWVLAGEIDTFPLLYAWRICRRVGEKSPVDMERHNGYVKYWGGDAGVSRYMLDRADADHELVLFLEHIPQVLSPWLLEDPSRAAGMLAHLRRTISFLRSKGIIHFDAHYHNILTDGELPYLTDFGLVLDRSFDLSPEELAFFEQNSYYDFGEVLACLGYLLMDAYDALPDEGKHQVLDVLDLERDSHVDRVMASLLANVQKVNDSGTMTLAPGCLDVLLKYRDTILLMQEFYKTLRGNDRKDTPLPGAELQRLLEAVDYV